TFGRDTSFQMPIWHVSKDDLLVHGGGGEDLSFAPCHGCDGTLVFFEIIGGASAAAQAPSDFFIPIMNRLILKGGRENAGRFAIGQCVTGSIETAKGLIEFGLVGLKGDRRRRLRLLGAS